VSGFVTGFAQAELAGPLSAGRGDGFDTVLPHARALPAERYAGISAALADKIRDSP
jgi:hypothetical protein